MLPIAMRAFSPVRAVIGTGAFAAAGGVYDVGWNGVSKTGTAVSAWADIRGSAAPSSASTMAPATPGTNNPTQATTPRSPVVTTTGNKWLKGPEVAGMDSTGNGSVCVVGLCGGASSDVGGVSGNNADLSVGTNASSHYCSELGTTDLAIDSGVACDGTTVRALFATANGTAGQVCVGNHAVQTSSSVTNSANTGAGMIQGFGTSNTSAWFFYYSTQIWTSVQFAFLTLFGMSRFGAVVSA